MKAQEKKEIIEVFEKLIKHLKENLDSRELYFCNMRNYIGVFYMQNFKRCGFNDRMIPQALEYLKAQRPTAVRNKETYYKTCFNRVENPSSWWIYTKHPASFINTEKIDFLKHLINKLKN